MPKCEFYVTAAEEWDGAGGGLRVIGVRKCPRNLNLLQMPLANPGGILPCPLYDQEKCARAYGEAKSCPAVRRKNTKRRRSLY